MSAARAARAADADLPEPDRLPGAPHPRETQRLYGQGAAEAAFLATRASGRPHHAWLITGPRGVGKATLAWRIARHLLAPPPAQEGGFFGAPAPPATLDIPEDHPVARRLLALSEPRLLLIRRGPNDSGKALSAEIRVDEVRRLRAFCGMSAADGGARVVIIDAADEMNVSAANAALKLLEEPPADTTFLLVCHQPARLLPTIRSRCRTLALSPLGPEDLRAALAQAGAAEAGDQAEALAELSEGSVGAAFELAAQDGPALYAQLLAVLADLPRLDRRRLVAMAASGVRAGADGRLPLYWALCDRMLARLARTGAMGPPAREAAPGEAAILARLAPDAQSARRWAEAQQILGQRVRAGLAVNLDPEGMVLDMWLGIEAAAQGRPVLS